MVVLEIVRVPVNQCFANKIVRVKVGLEKIYFLVNGVLWKEIRTSSTGEDRKS